MSNVQLYTDYFRSTYWLLEIKIKTSQYKFIYANAYYGNIQGASKVSVYLMITIQKATSNVSRHLLTTDSN
jgi:hypothetical protein